MTSPTPRTTRARVPIITWLRYRLGYAVVGVALALSFVAGWLLDQDLAAFWAMFKTNLRAAKDSQP